MTDRDQETGNPLPPNVFEPGEEGPEPEEPEGSESEAEALESEAEALEEAPEPSRIAEPKQPGRRWFGLLGRKTPSPTEGVVEAADSVRGAHAERVYIDDRASALFALVCAGSLVGVLAVSFAATHLPRGAVKTLPPLVVQTPSGSPSASASVLPSGSIVTSPSASPSGSPAPSASATPSATASPS
jgi:hypothetical protein